MIERIRHDIEQLAAFSESEEGVTRPSYTAVYRKAADYLMDRMREAGLTVREDSAGNIFGLLSGKNPALPKIISGSHLDSVRNGGAFDGTAGIVAALEAVRILRDRREIPPRSLEIAALAGEEGTRFGRVLLGSKIIAGHLGRKDAETIYDGEGISLADALAAWNGKCDLETARRKSEEAAAFVEPHIEQGPILEQEHLDLGIVSHVRGVCWLRICIEGAAGHAGTTPMESRKDAGTAAYALILAVTNFVTEHFPESAAVTNGCLELFPGSSNVIPGKCVFTLDIRSSLSCTIDEILDYVGEQAALLQKGKGCSVHIETLGRNDSVTMDSSLADLLEQSVKASGYKYRTMDSGAGHDAMELASLWKTAILFIPSAGGITHHPAEHTDFADMEKAARVLAHFMLNFPDNF